jgi:protease-4
MDDIHEQFIKAVSEGRNIPIEKTRALADGRIFSGRQAIKAGLVDEVGDLEYAVKTAAKLAGIEGDPEIVSKAEKGALSRLIEGKMPEELSRVLPDLNLKYMYYMYMP